MAVFFGTDGIRGIVNDSLNYDLTFKCGNSLGATKPNSTLIIGGDTRITRTFLTSAFAGGVMSAGAKVIDVGICPTAGIAYITQAAKVDFGIVISASHNPPEYNGIKIFDNNGFKIGDKKEEALERKFINTINNDWDSLGTYEQDFSLVKLYENHLIESCETTLEGLIILLDGSNGASCRVAPAVFRALGAKVIATHCKNDGVNINNKCGSLYPEVMAKAVKKYKADMGFAFDGDSDRIIACDENGRILDGDIIIYMLAKYFKKYGKLINDTVVGTRHTNMGLEKSLNNEGIKLIRTDIGDKYVIAKLEEKGLSLGGEKSGHIIVRNYSTTGDGILAGIKIAEMVKVMGKKLSELADVELYPQCNIDCVVDDKVRIINSERLANVITEQEKILGEGVRIMVRVSGTEPKVRIMVEYKDEQLAITSAKEIEQTIYDIENEKFGD